MSDLKFTSMNCRGLAQYQKRRDVLNYLKHSKADIFFLQETHMTQQTIQYFNTVWSGKCYHSTKTSNSRGTAILIRSSLAYDLITEYCNSDGSLVLIVCKINNNVFTLISIHGPNDDTPSFYNAINDLLQQYPNENIIIGGDFNFVIDLAQDSNYENDNNMYAKRAFLEVTKKHGLIDVWRKMHPHSKEYTWTKQNPLKYGRLDMFFASEHLQGHFKEAKIGAGYRTDHSQIFFTLIGLNQEKGPGLWKFNESLLLDDEYSNLIKSLIIDVIQQYAVPTYSIAFLSNPKNFEQIQLTINVELFYETLLMLIRGETVRYSKRKARKFREEEQTITNEIIDLRNKYAQTHAQSDLNKLQKAQEKLEKIREPRIQGAITRSRVRWYEEGERCTKFFLSLEKRNGIRKSVQSLSVNDKTITKKKDILSQFTQFLENKYSVPNEHPDVDVESYINQNIIRKLNNDQKQKLDEPLTFSELTNTLFSFKKGRSPGSNGFTADFFKHFWEYIGIFLHRTFQENVKKNMITLSHRESIITLIPKAGKSSLNSLKDWRPISLLNVDFKIISSALTNRLKSVMNEIISPAQSAYIKGRYIGENSRLVYDVIDKVSSSNQTGFILAADFEAAFESVSWSFLLKALDYYNFGPYCKHLVKLLYLNNDNFSRISLDGFLGEKIYMQRGIRQGDPASGYLFNLVVEPLTNQLMQSSLMRGIELSPGQEIRVSQYADDLIVFVDGKGESIKGVVTEIKTFTSVSGLNLNINKTKCMPIGAVNDNAPVNDTGIEYVKELKILGLTFNRNNNDITRINIMNKLSLIENEVSQWNRRHLTLLGKITVIKALLLSKLVHIFLALPNPSQNIISRIERIFYTFLWNNKRDRIKRAKLVQRQSLDGLSMVYLLGFIKSMKVTWIERLYKSEHSWVTVARQCFPEDLRLYGAKKIKKNSKNFKQPVLEGRAGSMD